MPLFHTNALTAVPYDLQNVLNYHYKCTLWSTFGPFLCLRSCKHTFYRHLSRIRKLTRFTRFIWKVFVTKILLSGKFSLFLTLPSIYFFSGFLYVLLLDEQISFLHQIFILLFFLHSPSPWQKPKNFPLQKSHPFPWLPKTFSSFPFSFSFSK